VPQETMCLTEMTSRNLTYGCEGSLPLMQQHGWCTLLKQQALWLTP